MINVLKPQIIREARNLIKDMKSLKIFIKKHVAVDGKEYWFDFDSALTTDQREKFLIIHETLESGGLFFRKEENNSELINTFDLIDACDNIKITFTKYSKISEYNGYAKMVITTFAKIIDANIERNNNGSAKSVELTLDSGIAVEISQYLSWRDEYNFSVIDLNCNTGPFVIARFE